MAKEHGKTPFSIMDFEMCITDLYVYYHEKLGELLLKMFLLRIMFPLWYIYKMAKRWHS